MPRNSSGTYSLPSGNPVVSNTLIQSTWANNTCSDLGSSITDSLDRNGRGAMLAALKNVDGTAVAPAVTFSSEGTLGLYRVAAGVLGIAAGGALVLSIASTGLTFTNPLVLPIGSATAPSVTFTSNTNTGLYSPGTNQVAITTNGAQRLLVDATGNITFATGGLTVTSGNLTLSSGTATISGTATAAAFVPSGAGVATNGLYLPAANTVAVSTSSTERVRVDASGNVGMNGAAASLGGNITTLAIRGSSAARGGGVRMPSSDGSIEAVIYAADGLGTVGTLTAHPLQLVTSNVERMRIDSSGNFGIGVTPGARFDLATGTTNRLRISEASSTLFFDSLNNAASAWSAKTERATSYNWFSAPSGTPASGMLLDSSGRVGIGMTPTANKLEVGGSVSTLVSGALDTQFAANVNGVIAVALGGNNSGSNNSLGAPTGTAYVGSTGSGVALVFTTSSTERLRITNAGVIQDAAGNELGYKGLPQQNQAGAYTLVAGDRGKHVYQRAAANVTVPSGTFGVGDAVTIVNGTASNITVVQGASVTMQQAGTTNTGNRTLLANGVCTLICVSSNTFYISGTIT